jgi:cyclic beta-1,2-glucan synthetase
VPGVRENGAQYTHAALWSVLATALQSRNDRAFELFQMVNPLTRTTTPEDVATYRVEPYVVAADVYYGSGAAWPRWLDVVYGLRELDVPRWT